MTAADRKRETASAFCLFLDGFTVRQPFSGYDLEVEHPGGKRSHLFPAYDGDYAYSHEGTVARAMRFIALTQHRAALAVN